jgi:hypothetical protein
MKSILSISCRFTLGNKVRKKDGENRIFDEVTPVATLRSLHMNKLDEVCTNADDRMMLVRHRSGDRVMS